MKTQEIIDSINKDTDKLNPVHYYLNGGCYIFSKKLQSVVGGELRYLTLEHHFILSLNNKLYDATGNVTNKYKNSKYISEEQFMQREKLRKSINLNVSQK